MSKKTPLDLAEKIVKISLPIIFIGILVGIPSAFIPSLEVIGFYTLIATLTFTALLMVGVMSLLAFDK